MEQSPDGSNEVGGKIKKDEIHDKIEWLKKDGPEKPGLFILGADDPEMVEIESILRSTGKVFKYALCNGTRVHPGNAYVADPVDTNRGPLVLIECGPRNLADDVSLIGMFGAQGPSIFVIDHHQFGDPGFGLSPERFFEASSIGQLYKLLKLGDPTEHHLTLAAMDHCMVHARQGKCPGVASEDVKKLSRKYIATRKMVTPEAVEACVETMRVIIVTSPVVTIGTQAIANLTAVPIGVGYSLEYLCILEALADLELAALLASKNQAGEPEKVILYGAAKVETIESFMGSWAPGQGLIKIYGVPKRGYAGGYREPI